MLKTVAPGLERFAMEFWGNDLVMEFLDLYEREPVIWNPQHQQHKDRDQVYEAWKRIQSRMGIECSMKELKKRKEKLMATFRKIVVKIRKSKGTGDLYKTEWFAFNRMASFLHSVYTPKRIKPTDSVPNGSKAIESSGTVTKEVEKKDPIPIEPSVEIKEEPADYTSNPSTSNNTTNDEFILPHEENSWTASESVVEPQFTLSVASLASPNGPENSDVEQLRKKRKTMPTKITTSNTFVPPATNGPEVRPQSPVYNFAELSTAGSSKEFRKDQFDVFGEYIAAKLRSLDRRSCAFAQKAIGDIIFEAEMGKYLKAELNQPQIGRS